MGEEADFYGLEGVARPELVAALASLPKPPVDPELLARLIDGHAGTDIDLGLIGFEAARRAARSAAFPILKRLQADVRSLQNLTNKHRNLDLLETVLADLLANRGTKAELSSSVAHLMKALEVIDQTSLVENKAEFGFKPVSDEAVGRVVRAVACYYARMRQPFTGEPRRMMTDTARDHIVKSEPAILITAILTELGAPFTAKSLATHMKKARADLSANLPAAKTRA